MSNSATALTAVKLFDKRRVVGESVTPIIVNIDTQNSAVTIKDVSSSTGILAIVGCQYVSSDAHTLTILSDETELATFDFAANDGISFAMGDSLSCMLVAKQGEALNVKASAAIGKILFYVVELDA